MSKFVLVEDYGDFDKIKKYINMNRKKNYYIAPKLMYQFLSSLRYKCVAGIIMEDIRACAQDKFDLIVMPVYNKAFQQDVFRIDGIKDFFIRKVNHELEYDSVIFGIDDDISDFMCLAVEDINKQK